MSMPEKGGKIAIVEVPNWRFDILHPIDIIEDIIIGHGYENLPSSKPTSSMTGVPRVDHNMRKTKGVTSRSRFYTNTITDSFK